MKKQIMIAKIAVSAILFFLIAVPVLAQGLWDEQVGLGQPGSNEIAGAFNNPDADQRDLRKLIVNIINFFLSFMGLVFVALIIWGGFRWMTAAGEQDSIREAKAILTAGIIGFIIVMLALIIANMVMTAIRQDLLGEPF